MRTFAAVAGLLLLMTLAGNGPWEQASLQKTAAAPGTSKAMPCYAYWSPANEGTEERTGTLSLSCHGLEQVLLRSIAGRPSDFVVYPGRKELILQTGRSLNVISLSGPPWRSVSVEAPRNKYGDYFTSDLQYVRYDCGRVIIDNGEFTWDVLSRQLFRVNGYNYFTCNTTGSVVYGYKSGPPLDTDLLQGIPPRPYAGFNPPFPRNRAYYDISVSPNGKFFGFRMASAFYPQAHFHSYACVQSIPDTPQCLATDGLGRGGVKSATGDDISANSFPPWDSGTVATSNDGWFAFVGYDLAGRQCGDSTCLALLAWRPGLPVPVEISRKGRKLQWITPALADALVKWSTHSHAVVGPQP